jgi:hypothetical protein
MLRRATRAVVIASIAIFAALLPLNAASAASNAGHYYGPYNDQGTCNYWQYGVAAGGASTTPCWYTDDYFGPEYGGPGWYFYVY